MGCGLRLQMLRRSGTDSLNRKAETRSERAFDPEPISHDRNPQAGLEP